MIKSRTNPAIDHIIFVISPKYLFTISRKYYYPPRNPGTVYREVSSFIMRIVPLTSSDADRKHAHQEEVSVWADYSPTLSGCIVYLFVVPFFCMIGIVTNSINIWIFSRPRVRSLACSAYFYFKGS